MRTSSFLLIVFFSVPSIAHAWSADNVRAQAKAAKKACAAGDYRKGVEILAGLYVDTDDATFIYNQGRCYEQNHQWESAVDRFREYLLKTKNASIADKTDVEKHMADCESLLEKRDSNTSPVPALPAPAVVSLPPPSPPLPEAEKVEFVQPPSEAHLGSGLRLTGLALASVGVATLATGLVLNLKANSLADQANNTHDPSTLSSHSSYRTGSIICYGAGAGAVLAGGALYLLGRPGSKATPAPVVLLPILAPEEISLAFRGSF